MTILPILPQIDRDIISDTGAVGVVEEESRVKAPTQAVCFSTLVFVSVCLQVITTVYSHI